MNIRRGDVYPAEFAPVVGKEISKRRSVVAISHDKNSESIMPIFSAPRL
jgi:mRNA-degrading endonuclease toxin of MazEF toxin-antitoxin module